MLKIPVDGNKYTIQQDETGAVQVLRYGERWLPEPLGSNMLISAAYELGVLRRLVKEAFILAANIKGSDAPEVQEALPKFEELAKKMEGYIDYRRHLDEPGEI